MVEKSFNDIIRGIQAGIDLVTSIIEGKDEELSLKGIVDDFLAAFRDIPTQVRTDDIACKRHFVHYTLIIISLKLTKVNSFLAIRETRNQICFSEKNNNNRDDGVASDDKQCQNLCTN